MKENMTEKDMELWLRQYLEETFGESFNTYIVPPEGAKYGERLIYKYKSNAVATRYEPTQQDVADFNAFTAKLAKECGGTSIPGEMPTTSGLPFPRFVDLKISDLFWEKGVKKYHESKDLLPTKDFDLEYALGLMFGSDKTLCYLNFTHQKVKGTFTFDYDGEFDIPKYDALRKRFMEFDLLIETYKKLSDKYEHFEWVKIAQIDSAVTITINN